MIEPLDPTDSGGRALALNNAHATELSFLEPARFARLVRGAFLARRIGDIDALLLAFDQDADYDSPNFRWFRERYSAFVYIDRIIIAKPYRGLGLGRVFYADVTSYAETRVPLLACEVFLEPRDDVSVLFHGTYGFQEVGQQTMPGVNRRVALLAKDLCSYKFVRDTYLGGEGLPTVPWLAERARSIAPAAKRAAGGV